MTWLRTIRTAGAGLAALVACVGATAAPAATCERTCLRDLVTRYVNAIVARDPAKLPTTGTPRFTENSQDLKLGEGMWTTVTGKGSFRHDYLDVKKQIAASHVVLYEGQTPVLYSVLLRVRDGRIAGVETLVDKVLPNSRFKPTELGKPVRGLEDALPAGARMTRADMIRTALTYTQGLKVGNFTTGGTPFADETYRVENGVVTAGEGCGRADCGMYTQKIWAHPDIMASVAAVDEENGTVLLWMNFGDTNSYGPGNALLTFEAFKVWGGKIHAINAFLHVMPVATQRSWPAAE